MINFGITKILNFDLSAFTIDIRTMSEICSKLIIKTLERYGAFDNFQQVSHIFSGISTVEFEQVKGRFDTKIGLLGEQIPIQTKQ